MADSIKHDSATTSSISDSDRRYRQLFETAQDGILLLHAWTSHIEDVNPFLILITHNPQPASGAAPAWTESLRRHTPSGAACLPIGTSG